VISITPIILVFCPNLSQRVYHIDAFFQSCDARNLKKRNESSKQHEDNQHASNPSLIILDQHKNLHNDSLHKIDNDSDMGMKEEVKPNFRTPPG
jgi:hypothetical protein